MKITRRLLLRCSAALTGSLALMGVSTRAACWTGCSACSAPPGPLPPGASSAASSAASSQPAASSAPALPPYDADPLTGQPKTGSGRMVGVMVNNICNSARQNARPQRGLSAASILIESKVEGNISRLCAVYTAPTSSPRWAPSARAGTSFCSC